MNYAYESLRALVKAEGSYQAFSQPVRSDDSLIVVTTFTRAENPTGSPYEANAARAVVTNVHTGEEIAVLQFDIPELIEALEALSADTATTSAPST